VFDSVLIANRGEIARRIIRTLRRLGVRAVAVHSSADRGMPFVLEADDAVRIGSYLDIAAIVDAARRTGAQAVHPGYGFLSERAEFARACADAGLVFVGPPPDAIDLMGDKVRAKAVAEAAGVPVVPSYTAGTAEYPLLVKAAAGGGGRGMRVVERAEDLEEAIAAARREALAGFGDGTVFLERFLPRARHIEVQVIGDSHGTIRHLGERECSLQRRHQKVVEESPSPVVGPELRERLGEEAVALARAAGYANAGTVEFIADFENPDEHYFLEMNARLQVEHPVTEMVTGLDLVELQLLVASGAPLPDFELRMDGHAMEVRVNAEDPARDFLPASGPVLAFRKPAGARVDAAVETGSVVGTDYDSMIAKVIAHAHDRETAIARLDRALADTAILGLTTNIGFLRRLLSTEELRTGAIDTGLLGRLELPPEQTRVEEVAEAAALIHLARLAERAGDDPFARVDGWRLGGVRASSWWRLAVDGGDPVEVVIDGADEHEVERSGPDSFAITAGGELRTWTYAYDGEDMWLARGGSAWRVRRASSEEAHVAAVHGSLRAPMPGQVLLVPASEGDEVKAGDPVVVIESMKMELTIAAPVDGVVTEIAVAPGDRVTVDQHVAHVEAA
jgi:acetyl-CoA/propionyl-CoA carboxylase biotin carboxyl carrier protein